MGIAHLLIMAMAKEGVARADAAKKIWMVDSRGLIVKVQELGFFVLFLGIFSLYLDRTVKDGDMKPVGEGSRV